MTTEDLMKLADKFAFFMPGSEEGEKARQALLDALEALGQEVAIEIELRGKAEQGLVDWAVKYANLEAELAAIRAQAPVDLNRLDPWVQGLGKAVLAELKSTQSQAARVPDAFPATKDAGLVAVFASAYWKACESSKPEDWLEAALTAQQILRSEKPASPKIGGV